MGQPSLSQVHQSFIYKIVRGQAVPLILLGDVESISGTEKFAASGNTANGFGSPDVSNVTGQSPTPAEAAVISRNSTKKPKDQTPYLSYIRMLEREQQPKDILERYRSGYQDHLQIPLQPLADDLESSTYEVFEKDPVKYLQYEKAITQALIDWKEQSKPGSGPDGRVVIAVVGAGRGPLVSRALQACDSSGIDIDLWAVEKNPNAYVVLQRRNEKEWLNRVKLIASDMRSWKGPSPLSDRSWIAVGKQPSSRFEEPLGKYSPTRPHYQIDIIISELLGSFGDNELSPECLDGILPLLNPEAGISIPASYTAYMTPITAPKLYADISNRFKNDDSAYDRPWVVMLYAIDYLSTNTTSTSSSESTTTPNIFPVWSFHHGPSVSAPIDPSNRHNVRHARLTFRIRDRGVCHGLGGYFEATLYPGIELSTNPNSIDIKSPGMISWFPIYFSLKVCFSHSRVSPLYDDFIPGRNLARTKLFDLILLISSRQTPLYIPDNAELTVSMSRCTDARKVWYDWTVESWGWTNLIGRGREKQRVRLGGGELGSSKKVGCLM